jgi:DNA-binding transcriptional MerR regulator
MRIGELAQRTGVSQRSLRYYEQHGLLRSSRGSNGWRVYDESAVGRVGRIATLLGNGLNLEGVKRLAECLEMDDSDSCADPSLALRTYQARLDVLDHRIAELRGHRDELAKAVRALGAQLHHVSGGTPTQPVWLDTAR